MTTRNFLVSVLVFFCGFSVICCTKNILVLEGVASPSHHIFIGTLNRALAARGYNVTSLCAEIETNSPNLTYLHLDRVYQLMYNTSDPDFAMDFDFFEMGNMNPILQYLDGEMYHIMMLEGLLGSSGFKQLKNYSKDFKFDLVINDFLIGFSLPLVHHFNYPPLIGLTAFHATATTHNLIGSQFYPSFQSLNFFDVDFSTFWGRIYNFFLMFFDWAFMSFRVIPKCNAILKEEFPESPPLKELMTLHKLVMMNKHPAVDNPEPVLPNLISVGGLQIQAPKALPEDLQKILDEAKDGVVLFSLGTNVKSSKLGEARITEILECFRNLPKYKFIWKFETELSLSVPENVIIRSWLPQSDILAHPNIILFITHAGLLSTQEATWYGVPLLNLPVFVDQTINAKLSVSAGMGETYNLRSIERNSFRKAILQVIEDPKYRQNAKIRAKNFQDQPEKPLERAIWWIEWILRNPDVSHLKSASLELNMIQRHSIDVVAFVTIVLLVWLILNLWIVVKIMRKVWKSKKISKSKKE
ncbi:hypothetical protein DMENIID0001_039810 [Sergentomyia squamirostris]